MAVWRVGELKSERHGVTSRRIRNQNEKKAEINHEPGGSCRQTDIVFAILKKKKRGRSRGDQCPGSLEKKTQLIKSRMKAAGSTPSA